MVSKSDQEKVIVTGVSSFAQLRQEDLIYIDKTRVIESLENCGSLYPILVRPRRFGKSLLTQVLASYYDRSQKDRFDELFAGTYIHRHPTKLRGMYYVLEFDFSGIDATGSIQEIFLSRIRDCLSGFFSRYPELVDEVFWQRQYPSPASLMSAFFASVGPKTGQKIYIIIDEYDQFANEVLAADRHLFQSIFSEDGFVKNFYSVIKIAAKTSVARIFTTGVTTVSLDSMTSGFNIAESFSTDPAFNEALGFTDDEVRRLISYVVPEADSRAQEIFFRMKDCFDGYRFCADSPQTVFNATLCLQYLRAIQRTGKEPAKMQLSAVSTDINKIDAILSLGNQSLKAEIVNAVVQGKVIDFNGLSESLNLNQKTDLSRDDVLSVLFYFGYLTFVKGNEFALTCPNKVMREEFFTYYLKKLNHIEIAANVYVLRERLAKLKDGDIVPFLQYVSESLGANGLHQSAHFSESNIQTAIQAMAAMTSDYRVTLEEEALGLGYTDLVFRAIRGGYSYLLELKYLAKADAEQPGAVEHLVQKAKEQIRRYRGAPNLAEIKNLKSVVAVFAGPKLCAWEVLPGSQKAE